jgi:putative hemolysin
MHTSGILHAALLFFLLVLVVPAGAMLDPSAVYCTKSGYAFEKVVTSYGSEYGVCRLPDHRYVDSWEFLRGRVGQQYNYCTRMGYQSKTSRDPKTCMAVWDSACTVCVLPDHREVEVTTLMNLSFLESTCGDGRCGTTENFQNCPADCPQSGADDFCQQVTDLRCDPDCIGGKGDIDCMLTNPLVIIMVLAVIAAAIAGWFLLRKKRE